MNPSAILRQTLRVMRRRLGFTAISIFGIAVTLTVLLVAAAMLTQVFGGGGLIRSPEKTLYVLSVYMTGPDNYSSSHPGFGLLDRWVRPLEGIETMAIASLPRRAISFSSGSRQDFMLKHTDAEFWSVLEFEFLEGQAFTAADEASGQSVAVINRSSAERTLGHGPWVGRDLDLDGQNFRVIGVVEDVSVLQVMGFADAWVPISTLSSSGFRHQLRGGWQGILVATEAAGISGLQTEFQQLLGQIDLGDPEQWTEIRSGADTLFEAFARVALSSDFETGTKGQLLGWMSVLVLAFMALPAINLVTLANGRLAERHVEIGIRKAFGATWRSLMLQVLAENLVLTATGAVIAVGLSAAVLELIEAAGWIPYAELGIGLGALFWGVVFTFVLGLLSGLAPALRLARLAPALAIRGGVS